MVHAGYNPLPIMQQLCSFSLVVHGIARIEEILHSNSKYNQT